jgi:hypothetical protein
MTNKAKIGSIISGTLRTSELLIGFAAELDYLNGNDAATKRVDNLPTVGEGDETAIDESTDAAAELLSAFYDELNELAPSYCRFGSHEGDGADFGFWPDMGALEELPRVDDPADVEGMGEDCVFVNDHGNMTVYAADGSVIFTCV